MLHSHCLLAGLVIPLLSSFGAAVSLSDFTPRNTNLPRQCEAAYTQMISGCQASDFTNGDPNICSRSCVTGLVGIQNLIQANCAGVEVEGTSMVGLFQQGSGISVLCPNFKVETIGPTQTPTSTSGVVTESIIGGKSQTPSPSPVRVSSSIPDSSAASRSQAVQPSVTSSGGLAVDTTAAPSQTPGFAGFTKTSSAGKKPASTQKSNKDSGGGSPFDVQATDNAGTIHVPLLGLLAALTVLIANV